MIESRAPAASFWELLEAVPDAMVVAGEDGRILRVNEQTVSLFGYSRDELIGQPIEVLLPERFRGAHSGHRTDYFGHPRRRPMGTGHELFGRRKDGTEFPAEISLAPTRLADGFFVAAAVRDITARKRVELEIRALNADLERRVQARTAELEEANGFLARAKDAAEAASQELEAFSYSVAHDLRAPLRGMTGFAQLLVDSYGGKLDAEGQDWLAEILLNARRMGTLIDALLALSRVTRTPLHREWVDLSAIARGSAARLSAAEPERAVEMVVQDGCRAELDPALARVLVDNLLENAWKFTRKVPAARVELGAAEKDGVRAFYVRDNGAGFDMAFASKLFAPFQRLHTVAEFPGTGIGLATARRIVQSHGGRMWAEGKVGGGATFYFSVFGHDEPSVVSPVGP